MRHINSILRKFGGQSLQRLKTVSAFAPPKIQSNKNPSRVFLALESHSARADGHLSFNVGQRIEIADYSDDHDLLIGKLDNNVGGLIARDTLENCLHPEGMQNTAFPIAICYFIIH